MSLFSQSEADAALVAKTWDAQIFYIEKLESKIMDLQGLIKATDVKRALHVLTKYLEQDNKNVVQRSMKIIETVCNISELTMSSVNELVPSLVKCWSDQRQNIRKHTTKIISAIAPQLNLKANYDLDELRQAKIIEASWTNGE